MTWVRAAVGSTVLVSRSCPQLPLSGWATRQALLGGFRDWGGRGPFYGTGYYCGGGLGLLLVLLLVAIGRV